MHISLAILIDLALVSAISFTLCILRDLRKQYGKEICHIALICSAFFLSYSAQIGYDTYAVLTFPLSRPPAELVDEMETLWLPFVWSMLPLLVVLVLHARVSYWTKRRQKRVESKERTQSLASLGSNGNLSTEIIPIGLLDAYSTKSTPSFESDDGEAPKQ